MMPIDRPELLTATKQVATRSVLNPMLWLTGIGTPSFLLAANFSQGFASAICYLLAALPLLVAIGAYIFFAWKDPNRLQSEDFVLKQQAMGLYGDNSAGTSGRMKVARKRAINNPMIHGIES